MFKGINDTHLTRIDTINNISIYMQIWQLWIWYYVAEMLVGDLK